MKHLTKLVSLCALLTSGNTYALVDYSDESPTKTIAAPETKGSSVRQAPKRSSQAPAPSVARSASTTDAMFSIKGGYHSLNVKTREGEGKVSMLSTDLHFQTSYDIFLDAKHYYASSDSKVLDGDGKNHSGNPTVKLGFNWLELGERHSAATIDFIGGAMIKGNSKFASTRTDKIVGIETSKRFYDFALGLGYELRLTGTPSKVEEVAIGNITRIGAALGWVATPDIRFLLEGASYTISPYKSVDREARLTDRVAFSYLSPQVHLGLASVVELTLGGRFKTKSKGVTEDLIGAQLWDLETLYGNSIFTGINISL